MRIWPSLDFSIGLNQAPKPATEDKSTQKVLGFEFWEDYRSTQPRLAKYWQKVVNEFLELTATNRLTLGEWGELFSAFTRTGDIVSAYYAAGMLDLVVSERRSPMGLSAASNSHKSMNGLNQMALLNAQKEEIPRALRGTKGITPFGKKMVRSAGAILEERYGRRCLTLGCCTLPALQPEEYELVCKEWAELVRKFFQEIQRLLVRHNLSSDYVQVSEIQEKRWERWGQLAPHLHWVVQGRTSTKEMWRITPTEIKELWERMLGNLLGRSVDGKAATRIEAPRKSLQAELGKYMSKGAQIITAVHAAGKGDLLPRAWWGCSKPVRAEVKARIIVLVGELPDFIDRSLKMFREQGLLSFTYIYREVAIEGGTLDICIGSVGRFKNKQSMQEVLGYESLENLLTA